LLQNVLQSQNIGRNRLPYRHAALISNETSHCELRDDELGHVRGDLGGKPLQTLQYKARMLLQRQLQTEGPIRMSTATVSKRKIIHRKRGNCDEGAGYCLNARAEIKNTTSAKLRQRNGQTLYA